MKSKFLLFLAALVAAVAVSCSKDDDPKVKGDKDVTHTGQKWNIASVEYMLIDQSATSQVIRNGTRENAGSFYFVEGEEEGSFEMSVEGYNKEDFFNYTIDQGSVSIVDIEQSAGITTNQNILVLSGEATDTEMTMDGTITKQSATGQFLLTLSLTLVKN